MKDSCFPYRYYDRGCYYTGKLKFYEGLLISTFANTNLTHEEKVELCYKFAFKGSTAWCLRGNAENEMEKQKEIILKTFSEWKGNITQVDDVCVAGIRI